MRLQLVAASAAALAWIAPCAAQEAEGAAEAPAAAASPQEAEAPAPTAEAPAACCLVPKLTPVEVEIVDRVNSKLSKTGQRFAIRLAEPIVVDGRTLAPAGMEGEGEVVHAAKAGIGGKAGELILAARFLKAGTIEIPLRSLRYGRSQGNDKTGAVNTANMAAAAVLPIASVVGFLIAGGEVDIPAGTRAHAKLSADTVLPPLD